MTRTRTLLTLAMSLSALACGSTGGHRLPADFLGRWYETDVSGGIDGTGGGMAPSGHIVVSQERVDYFDQAGALVRSIPHVVSRGSTIFSAEDMWILERGDGIPLAAWTSEDGTALRLSENVYDGFSHGYARSPRDDGS